MEGALGNRRGHGDEHVGLYPDLSRLELYIFPSEVCGGLRRRRRRSRQQPEAALLRHGEVKRFGEGARVPLLGRYQVEGAAGRLMLVMEKITGAEWHRRSRRRLCPAESGLHKWSQCSQALWLEPLRSHRSLR